MNKRRAFTLVEMLVACSVLMLLFVLFAQILGWTTQSWATGKQTADNLGKARSALEIITRDLQLGLFRDDLGAFTDIDGGQVNDGDPVPSNFCFYTFRSAGGARPVSLINYRLIASNGSASLTTLERQALPVSWGNEALKFGSKDISNLPQIASGNSAEIASGILAFQMYFIHTNSGGERSTGAIFRNDASMKTNAVGVALVVLDEQSRQLLESAGKLQNLIDIGWTLPANLDQGLSQHWQQSLDSYVASPAGADIPVPVRGGIRVFETVVPIQLNQDLSP